MVTNRKNLAEIVQAVPNAAIGAKFTCKAVISEVIYDYEPFYFACIKKECRKKVVPSGSKHWCDNCKNFVDYPFANTKDAPNCRPPIYVQAILGSTPMPV